MGLGFSCVGLYVPPESPVTHGYSEKIKKIAAQRYKQLLFFFLLQEVVRSELSVGCINCCSSKMKFNQNKVVSLVSHTEKHSSPTAANIGT